MFDVTLTFCSAWREQFRRRQCIASRKYIRSSKDCYYSLQFEHQLLISIKCLFYWLYCLARHSFFENGICTSYFLNGMSQVGAQLKTESAKFLKYDLDLFLLKKLNNCRNARAIHLVYNVKIGNSVLRSVCEPIVYNVL